MSLSAREATLAIIPKITGGFSMISSGLIAYKVISNKPKRTKTYHRLMAAMSIVDIISSFCYFLSTWPIPQGENLGWGNPYHYAAFGTDATCTAQGVGIQFGVTSAILNVMLSMHYLLVIRYNYTEASLKKLEPYFLSIAFLFGLGLTIPGIFTKMYGNTNLWCWISANFSLCEMEGMTREACVLQAYNNRWGFYYGPLWSCIAIITIAQLLLFATVYKMEAKASKWRKGDTKARQFRQSHQVAVQAALYVGVFYVTWLPYTSIALTGKFFNPHSGFGVLLMVVLCQPSQGIFNLIVYRRRSIRSVAVKAYETVSARTIEISDKITPKTSTINLQSSRSVLSRSTRKLPAEDPPEGTDHDQDITKGNNAHQTNSGDVRVGKEISRLALKNEADKKLGSEPLELAIVDDDNTKADDYDDDFDDYEKDEAVNENTQEESNNIIEIYGDD